MSILDFLFGDSKPEADWGEISRLMQLDAELNRTNRQGIFSGWNWEGGQGGKPFTQVQSINPALAGGVERLMGNANREADPYQSAPQYGAMQEALMANQMSRLGIKGNMFSTPETETEDTPDYSTVPTDTSPDPGPGFSGEGGNFGRAGEGGSAWARDAGYAPSLNPSSGRTPRGWAPPSDNVNYGSMTGLNIAEKGRGIGMLVGALLGIPGMGAAGSWLGNNYINRNVFQNPADIPPQSSPMDNFFNEVDAGANFNEAARQNSSPIPSGPRYSDGTSNPVFDQSRNRNAGAGYDFRTQWN